MALPAAGDARDDQAMTVRRLHDDHTTLRPAVDALRATAEKVDTASIAEIRHAVEADRIYLQAELLPHIAAEEEVLYPALRTAMGSVTATVGMEHDHAQIRAYAAEIAAIDGDLADVTELSAELASRVRRTFYGLYAVMRNHFDKEEAHYHPFLQRTLTTERQAQLAAALDAVAAQRALAATS